MLGTILRGERALEATFSIIETFAKVRELKRELVELHKETDKACSDRHSLPRGSGRAARSTRAATSSCSALPMKSRSA